MFIKKNPSHLCFKNNGDRHVAISSLKGKNHSSTTKCAF